MSKSGTELPTKTYYTRVWVGKELIATLWTKSIPEFRDGVCILEGTYPGCGEVRKVLKGSLENFTIVSEEHLQQDQVDDIPF